MLYIAFEFWIEYELLLMVVFHMFCPPNTLLINNLSYLELPSCEAEIIKIDRQMI